MLLLSIVSTVVVAMSALVPSVSALPTSDAQLEPRYAIPNLAKLQAMMPKSTLPSPDGLQLKFVGLGIGTQNYTCGDDPNKEPGTTGATAKLYDLGSRLNDDPWAKLKIPTISGLALAFYHTPKMLESFLQFQGYQRVLGDHFFTEKTPTFSLNKVPTKPIPVAYVTKGGFMDAPKMSCPGLNNEGAVQWLQLIDDNARSQGGINTVYRLETAGGNKPKTCQGMKKTFEVPYAAQYWVFGPKA